MINVEIIKVHAGQILLPCGRVTGNKEFTIGGQIDKPPVTKGLVTRVRLT